MRRAWAVALLVAAAFPAAGSAATVEVRNLGGAESWRGTPGERDRIVAIAGGPEASAISASVAHDGGTDAVVTVRDAAGPLGAGPGCHAVDPRAVRCGAPGMRPRLFAALRGGADAFALVPGQTWQTLEVWGGRGDDVLDTAGAAHFRAPWETGDEDDTEWWELLGGRGDDRLTGGADRDHLFGGPGADELRGGPGDDWLEGRGGGNRLYGEAGDDWIAGGKADVADDGGAGDDTLAPASPRVTAACGEGDDVMAAPDWGAEAAAPGPLFGLDCERGGEVPMRPAVAAGVATFTWRCGADFYEVDRCTRPITLRWEGERMAARFVVQRRGRAVARVPLSPRLRAALAAGPAEVAITIPDVEFGSGLDAYFVKWVRWRVVLPQAG